MINPQLVRSGIAIAVCVLATGCADKLSPAVAIEAHCAPCQIQPGGGPFVSATFRNVSTRTVTLASCGSTLIPIREQLDIAGEWTPSPLATCSVALQRVALAPGEIAHTGFYNFRGQSGQYRFRAPLYRDGSQRSSPDVSSTFAIY